MRRLEDTLMDVLNIKYRPQWYQDTIRNKVTTGFYDYVDRQDKYPGYLHQWIVANEHTVTPYMVNLVSGISGMVSKIYN